MPNIFVDIDESDLFEAVGPSDAIAHWGESQILEEMDIGSIRDAAIERSKPAEILSKLDVDDIKAFLASQGYEFKESEK